MAHDWDVPVLDDYSPTETIYSVSTGQRFRGDW
jgi:hypothetical protein